MKIRGLRSSDVPAVTYGLSMSATNGTVTKLPDKAGYAADESVILTAVPASGYRFLRWEGDASGTTSPLTLPMDRNRSVTAVFEVAPASYTLTVNAANGTVTRAPDKTSYDAGESVALTATPASGYVFTGWSGDASGTDAQVTVVMDRNRTVTANFTATYTLVVTSAHGTVTRNPDKALYVAGEIVTLTAAPESGYRFFRWTGGAAGTLPTVAVTMSANRTITAEYHQIVDIPPDRRQPGTPAAVGTMTAPVIDGTPDGIWDIAPLLPITLPVTGTAAGQIGGAADLSANWSALWDANALYLLVVVTDDRVGRYGGEWDASPSWWADDSVEIYVDPDLSRGATYDKVNDLQIGIRPLDPADIIFYGANSVKGLVGVRTAAIITDDGYVLEMALPWSALGVSAAGRSAIGIEVAVNDGDINNGGWPPARLGWVSDGNNAASNPSVFGQLPLASTPPAVQVTPSSDPTNLGTGTGSGNLQVLSQGAWSASAPSWIKLALSGADWDWNQIVGSSGLSTLNWSVENGAALTNRTGTITVKDGSGNTLYSLNVTQTGSGGQAAMNISARTQVGIGEKVVIPGFTLGGSSKTKVLLRAVGPSLTGFGVSGVVADPKLTIYRSTPTGPVQIGSNDSWQDNQSVLQTVFTEVGAFSLTSALDAAGVVELDPGSYTMLMSGVGDTTGIGLAEIYVLDAANNRGLINLSTRAEVAPGERVLIPGFVIGGTQPMQVLIRGVGPELARYGVANPLADPTMEVIDQNTKAVLASNDDWGSAANLAELRAAMTAQGAFSLAEGSADSAVLITLPPGSYTAVISGKGDATGIALMEVYPILPY